MNRGPDDSHAACSRCVVCGGAEFSAIDVLWPELIEEWGLSAEEAEYIDRQQGRHCTACRSSVRSNALATAIRATLGFEGTLHDLAEEPRFHRLKILEINAAGELTGHLARLPEHRFVSYPDVDMLRLPFDDGSFDLVVHSDTLEHVPDPSVGLAECCRVLGNDGACCFTVPMIVARLTRSRHGLPDSYHGEPGAARDDHLVHSEFGADAWTLAFEAGFRSVAIHAFDYPAGIALSMRK